MKIYTKSFRTYQKLITAIKDDFHPSYENIYLDFESNYAYVSNRNERLRFKFLWEKENDDEKPKNVFINITKFIPIIFSFEEIFFDGEKFYNEQGEKFKFNMINMNFDSSLDFTVDENEKLNLDFTIEFLELLKKSLSITNNDIDSPLNGVFFEKGYIFSSDDSKIFQSKCLSLDKSLKLSLPDKVIQLILLLSGISHKDDIKFYKRESSIVIKSGVEMDLIINNNSNLSFLVDDIEDDNYISFYNHDTSISFIRSEILELLKFIEPYLPTNENLKRRVVLKIASKEELDVEIIDENEVLKKLELVDCDEELIGGYLHITYDNFKQSLSLLYEGVVKMQIKKEPNEYKLINLSNLEIDDPISIKMKKLKIS